MNNGTKPQQIVIAKDARYLWIGLVCWVSTVAVGFLFSLDVRSMFVVCILIAMVLIPLVLIVMSFWKRHFFVGGALVFIIVLFCLLLPPRLYVGEAADRVQAAGNLRSAVIAIHNYHADHNHLPPPAITAPNGTPLLSWRVIILPYLGYEALYKEFHLNEPWDSEHNRKLIPRMPDIYKSVGKVHSPEHHTFIQVFVGPGTLFDPQRRSALGPITPHIGWNNIPLLAEGGHSVFWTKPEDIPFSVEKGIGPIGGQFPVDQCNYPCIHVAMADASLRTLRPSFNLEILCQAIQWKSTMELEVNWD